MWVICASTEGNKNVWMHKIADLLIKLKKDDAPAIHLNGVDGEAVVKTSFVNNEFHSDYHELNADGKPVDGSEVGAEI